MQPYGGAGGFEGRHALREKSAGETAQHIARTGGGEGRRQIPADRGASVRRGDDAVGSFIDYDRSERRRGEARPLELARRAEDIVAALKQPVELAFVRGRYRRAAVCRDEFAEPRRMRRRN